MFTNNYLQGERGSRNKVDVDMFFNKLKGLDCFLTGERSKQDQEPQCNEDQYIPEEKKEMEVNKPPEHEERNEQSLSLRPLEEDGASSPDYNDYISEEESGDVNHVQPVPVIGLKQTQRQEAEIVNNKDDPIKDMDEDLPGDNENQGVEQEKRQMNSDAKTSVEALLSDEQKMEENEENLLSQRNNEENAIEDDPKNDVEPNAQNIVETEREKDECTKRVDSPIVHTLPHPIKPKEKVKSLNKVEYNMIKFSIKLSVIFKTKSNQEV